MVTTKAEVQAILKANVDEIESLGVSHYALFGSFLRDEVSSDSDVDLLVEFQPGKKNFSNYSKLVFLLEELFGRRVEIVTRESLSPYIGPYILREAEYVALNK